MIERDGEGKKKKNPDLSKKQHKNGWYASKEQNLTKKWMQEKIYKIRIDIFNS